MAISEAGRLGHEYAGVEHLLQALVLDSDSARLLRGAGVDLPRLKDRIASYLEKEIEDIPLTDEPRLSLALERVLGHAAAQADSSGRSEVSGTDLVVALFTEPDSYATQLLIEEGADRLAVVSLLAHGGPPFEARAAGELEAELDGEDVAPRGAGDVLAATTRDLVAMAQEGAFDPLVGREKELSRALHVLTRRRKNNPIFVGDPGVGKTALVEGLASRVAAGEVPEAFADARLLALDLGALLAGTRYRGDFENRLREVLGALADSSQEGEPAPILFIDEVHELVGAGATGRGTLDAASLLGPALAGGRLRVIGATTWDEYRQAFEKRGALSRRFQPVEVGEPSPEEAHRILRGVVARYEAHHRVRYSQPAVCAAVDLSHRLLRDRRLPDKAIDLLDEAGAAAALAGRQRVGVREIEATAASMARVPATEVRAAEGLALAQLGEKLKAVVFGQDAAIDRLTRSIKVARAGLREPHKPTGAFLFTGPTGVGKTETARQLARVLGVSFLRFDMSEYRERHTVSRLVGAPPGYVGFDRGGLLTDAVAKDPHSVLLLDEIEKAHEDVWGLLLQVMDHGTLTDADGRKANFRHVLLLMTSNVGAREMERRTPGYGAADGGSASAAERAVERLFSPEFRNRLDGVLRFSALGPRVMAKIVDKLLGELEERLRPKKVTLEVDAVARAWLAERGHDPAFGARPLGRVIEENIVAPLTDALLFGKLARRGGTAHVTVEDGDILVRGEGR